MFARDVYAWASSQSCNSHMLKESLLTSPIDVPSSEVGAAWHMPRTALRRYLLLMLLTTMRCSGRSTAKSVKWQGQGQSLP